MTDEPQTKRIQIQLSRIIRGALAKPSMPDAIVVEQEPTETLTSSNYLVIPEQMVEVEIDEARGEQLEAKLRALLASYTPSEE